MLDCNSGTNAKEVTDLKRGNFLMAVLTDGFLDRSQCTRWRYDRDITVLVQALGHLNFLFHVMIHWVADSISILVLPNQRGACVIRG